MDDADELVNGLRRRKVFGLTREGTNDDALCHAAADKIESLRARLSAAEAERDRLRVAAQAFIDKVDHIHDDPKFKSVWAVNQLHCGPYTGPNYVQELADLRAALSSPSPSPATDRDAVLEEVADAIDAARYAHPEHPRERDRPFAEADRSDREYATRLARAAIRALQSHRRG